MRPQGVAIPRLAALPDYRLFSVGGMKGWHPAGRSIMLEELLLEGGCHMEKQQRYCCEHKHDVDITACFASLPGNARNNWDADSTGERRMSIRRQA